MHAQVDRRLSVSPKPRHRLKSTPNTKVTACILGDPNQSHDPLRPQSEQGYASLRENGHSFNFETGVYVPTKVSAYNYTGWISSMQRISNVFS